MSTDRLQNQQPARASGDATGIPEPTTPAPSTVLGRRSRPGLRRLAAASGTAALVAAVVAGVLLVVGHSTARSPAAGGHSSARGAHTIAAPALRRLAAAAPCDRVTTDPHPTPAARIATFHPVAVVGCRTDYRSYPGRGVWQVLVRSVATRPAPLLSALRRPDAHTGSGMMACPVVPAAGRLPILLADGHGSYLHPRVPTGACGAAQPQVVEALSALPWQTVSITRVAPVRTSALRLHRCRTDVALDGRPLDAPRLPSLRDQRLRACLLITAPVNPGHHRAPGPVRPVVPPH